MSYTVFCATPAMMYCWRKLNSADTVYSPIRTTTIRPMAGKSIAAPCTCRILPMSPVKITVVALPMIFGAKTAKRVLATARTSTATSWAMRGLR